MTDLEKLQHEALLTTLKFCRIKPEKAKVALAAFEEQKEKRALSMTDLEKLQHEALLEQDRAMKAMVRVIRDFLPGRFRAEEALHDSAFVRFQAARAAFEEQKRREAAGCGCPLMGNYHTSCAAPPRCPTCDSRTPNVYHAVNGRPCTDAWHPTPAWANPQDENRALKAKLEAAERERDETWKDLQAACTQRNQAERERLTAQRETDKLCNKLAADRDAAETKLSQAEARIALLEGLVRRTTLHPICLMEPEVAAHCKEERCALIRAALAPSEPKCPEECDDGLVLKRTVLDDHSATTEWVPCPRGCKPPEI